MAATINADNGVVSGSSGVKTTADTSGVLALQSNGTTGLTLNTSLAVGVGSGNSTGTSGQILTSAGSAAAPTWSNPASVSLTTGVTGTLPIANGGTGTTSTTFASLTTNVTGTLPIANGGTNSTATPTAGGAIYGTGTAFAVTAAGTSGQYLKSNGASAPTWVTASSGAMTLISTQTASSSATLDFTGLSVYGSFLLVFNNLATSASINLWGVQYGTGGTPTYTTSGYATTRVSGDGSSASTGTFNTTLAGVMLNSASASASYSGAAQIITPSSGNFAVVSNWVRNSSNFNGITGSFNSIAAAVTAIRVIPSSGNFSSGTVSLYGISS